MPPRRRPPAPVVAGLCAAIVLGIAVAAYSGTHGSSHAPSGGARAVAGATSGTDGTASTGPRPTDGADPASTPGGTTGANGGTGADGTTGGHPVTGEVPADAQSAPTALPGITPAPPAAPSLTGPLPASGSARGALVAGFPAQVVPVPAAVTVVSSSVSAEGNRLEVGLTGRSDQEPAAVQEAYDQAFAGTGFSAATSPAVPGSTAVAYVRGDDGIVVTVRSRLGGGTEMSVAATLTTSG